MAYNLLPAAIVSAAASLFNNGLQIFSNSSMSKKSYHYNMNLQQQAQSWQEKMSNTAHQREVNDLRAAGINPIYTATGGNGASVGGAGANSTGVIGNQFDLVNDYVSLLNVANQTKTTNAQANELDTQAQLNISKSMEARANIQKILNDSSLSDVQRRYYQKQLSRYDDVINAQIKELEAKTTESNSNAKYFDERSRGYNGIAEGASNIIRNFLNERGKGPSYNRMHN